MLKKRFNILFSILMTNNILLVYIYQFFHLGIFHRVPPYAYMYIYIYIYYSGVVSKWLWSWVLQIFDTRWLNNPVRLNTKVNSARTKKNRAYLIASWLLATLLIFHFLLNKSLNYSILLIVDGLISKETTYFFSKLNWGQSCIVRGP